MSGGTFIVEPLFHPTDAKARCFSVQGRVPLYSFLYIFFLLSRVMVQRAITIYFAMVKIVGSTFRCRCLGSPATIETVRPRSCCRIVFVMVAQLTNRPSHGDGAGGEFTWRYQFAPLPLETIGGDEINLICPGMLLTWQINIDQFLAMMMCQYCIFGISSSKKLIISKRK